MRRLPDLPDEELTFVLGYLSKYAMSNASVTPETKLAALNVLDSHLDSKVGPVFLSSAKLFHSVAVSNEGEKGESLSRDFVLRLKPCLVRFMKPSSNPAVQDFQLQLL